MALKSDVAREYRAKFPDKPTLALARIMYAKNKSLFKDVEDARSILRYIEGKQGEANKKKIGRAAEFIKDEARPYNPYKLPESDETSYEPYILKGFKKVLLLSDIHIPYHSVSALTAVFDYAKKYNPDSILLNGDTIDFHGLSRFVRDPRKRSFKYELDTFKQFFQVLDKQFPKAKKKIKLGNHEERYFPYLWQKAGELEGVEEFELENIIKARANGIDVIGDKRIIKAGALNVIHGHEFVTGISEPVNIARGLYNKGKSNAIQGHNHRPSEHTEPDMNGSITTTWSTGCLCELHPSYMPINKWAHGFATIDIDGKEFNVQNKRIKNGKIL